MWNWKRCVRVYYCFRWWTVLLYLFWFSWLNSETSGRICWLTRRVPLNSRSTGPRTISTGWDKITKKSSIGFSALTLNSLLCVSRISVGIRYVCSGSILFKSPYTSTVQQTLALSSLFFLFFNFIFLMASAKQVVMSNKCSILFLKWFILFLIFCTIRFRV